MLGIKGECVLIVVYVCVWCREGARETNAWETNDPVHKCAGEGMLWGGQGSEMRGRVVINDGI